MDTTLDRIALPTRQRGEAFRAEPELALNPHVTTPRDLAWFFAVPVVMALNVIGVIVTSYAAMH